MVLTDQAWLQAPGATAVMDALEALGGPDCARFVGGCVRNAVMGLGAHDVDIATRLEPPDAVRALEAAGVRVVPTGVAHGTVTAVVEGVPYEVTTLRRDVETDGRRAVVAFTTDWAEDAARRDFRLNALYADRAGRVFDPVGEGVADALAGRVVFVGEAEQRIREDHLRILRFFRFHAWYGRGAPDAEGLAACARLADGVGRLSAERVTAETLKLLAAPDPRQAIRAMAGAGAQDGVLDRVLGGTGGGPADMARFEALAPLSDDPVLRLAALTGPDWVEAGSRFRLPKAVGARIVAAWAKGPPDAKGPALRAAVYRDGAQSAADRLRLAWAAAPEQADALRRSLGLVAGWTPPRLPVGGRDTRALGVPAGPETGRLLKAFEDDWVAADFPDGDPLPRLRDVMERARTR